MISSAALAVQASPVLVSARFAERKGLGGDGDNGASAWVDTLVPDAGE